MFFLKSNRFCHVCLFSAFFLLFNCETVPEKSAPLPGEPIAYFPKMVVGDSWTFKVKSSLHEDVHIEHSRVIKVEDDGSFILKLETDKDTYQKYINNKGEVEKKINLETGKDEKDADPPRRPFNFPLFVGKRWSDAEYTSLSVKGNKHTYRNEYKVLKYETIDIETGQLWAFKIKRVNYILDGSGGPWTSYTWYAPAAKSGVKLRHQDYPILNDLVQFNIAKTDNTHTIIESASADLGQDKSDVKLPNEQIMGRRWAVIIGVSKYKDRRIPSLSYAASDARSFYSWLISPQGGGYAPARVNLMLEENATGENIRRALFSWLTQAIEEDIITIFFAGHGSPDDPASLNNLFLLPYDTDYQDIAATGFPMWDVETALKRFINAKRIVVITDACHAGGVGVAFEIARRGITEITANPISSSVQSLADIGEGIAVISASDDKQYSQESQKWGGGHGVFTYFLLKGLRGEADHNHDGYVTLGELILFLSENVRRETKNTQSPTIAGKFDPALGIGKK